MKNRVILDLDTYYDMVNYMNTLAEEVQAQHIELEGTRQANEALRRENDLLKRGRDELAEQLDDIKRRNK